MVENTNYLQKDAHIMNIILLVFSSVVIRLTIVLNVIMTKNVMNTTVIIIT